MEQIVYRQISLGCDPEFFFKKDGKILGSEKLLPKEGLEYDVSGVKGGYTHVGNTVPKVVIDGVQAELNPRPNTCRANLANELSVCFRSLYETVLKKGDQIGVDFSQAVEVTKDELDTLCDKSKTFGCAPSRNAYGRRGVSKISVDPKVYRYRSAGGHIHLGTAPNDAHGSIKKALHTPERTIPLLDLIVGNTCVLVDRDPSNIERRKVYGKAGEYRQPKHGLEYRTLSNFWLRSYPLMSMVMGLARQAVLVAASENHDIDFGKELLSKVKAKDVVTAINTNDLELARYNWNAIKDLLAEMTPTEHNSDFPVTSDNLPMFDHFTSKPLDYWFKEDPLEHWMKLPEGHRGGFESFLEDVVKVDMVTV